jgi:hypothetical protein
VDFTPVLGLLIVVVKAAVFGTAAYGMRKYFSTLIAVLLATNYFSLPPSDAKLERQFAGRKGEFKLLIHKSSKTPPVVRISNVEILDSDGRKYTEGDRLLPISPEFWTEYREIFKKTVMKEGLYRSPQTGAIQFLGHTSFGKLGPIGLQPWHSQGFRRRILALSS